MNITRITKLRHRVFRDFTWPSDLHPFAQFNLIYGWNGSGKTTLSSLLSLVQARSILTDGKAEIEFDGHEKISGSNFSSAQLPQVRVFNRDFINATLQSSDGIAPIYFLGKDSTEKQAQIEKLRDALSRVNQDVATETKKRDDANSKREDFFISQARIIKGILTTNNSQHYNNYDKRKFAQASEHLTKEQAATAILSDEQKDNYRKQKDAQPKSLIERIHIPALDIPALAKEVIESVNRSIVAQTLDELNNDKELAAWIQQGLSLHSGSSISDVCHFCHNPFSTTRRTELEAHFNDAFASFQHELDELHLKITATKRSISSLQLPEVSRFYDHLHTNATDACNAITTEKSKIIAALESLLASVETKRSNPFVSTNTVMVLDDRLNANSNEDKTLIPENKAPQDSFVTSIATFNTIIEKHNQITNQFTTSVAEACKQLESAYIAEVNAEYRNLTLDLELAISVLNEIKNKPTAIQKEIDELERQIIEHQRPADELTDELHAYLGRTELKFEVKGSGYVITRNSQTVSHLSEGERTAITFLYFLKSLQDKSFDMKKGIVVVDDPVSSLDANSLFSAFGYMKERIKECGQIFILTHSFPFFRLVKNWFHHLLGQKKKNFNDRPARFFLLHLCRYIDGLQAAQLGPLDRLLEEYESEYQYLFKRIYEAVNRTDVDSLEHHYDLPNIARRLLEAFLAFRLPEISGDLRKKLEHVQFDTAKKTRILRLLHTYSHADAIVDPEHDLSLLAETQPILRDMLDLMKSEDEGHCLGLEKMIASLNSTEESGE